MTDEEAIRSFQVRHARHLRTVRDGVGERWDDLGSYDDRDVDRWLTSVLPFLSTSNTQMAALVDGYVAQVASTAPLNVAATLPAFPRPTPPEVVYRRPFIDHWQGLSKGRTWESTVRTGRSRAVALAEHDTQMQMRAAMEAVVEIHLEEPEAITRLPRVRALEVDVGNLPTDLNTIAAEQRRLAALTDATAPPVTVDDTPRTIVGFRRVLTGRSCVFCATAATKVYSRGDLMPLHAHCDCSVAPVFLGADPALDLNRQVLTNLKARGKGYWKQRGFVDNDGRPVDPTDLPDALGAADTSSEVGAVFTNA